MFQKATKYIGVHLDRTPNFKQPMKKLRPRLHILDVINACLTGTTWGHCAITFRNSTQALVFSAAWIRVTVWNRTPHVKKQCHIDNIGVSLANSCVSVPSSNRDCLGESGQSHPGNEKRLAPPAWHHDYEPHPNSSPFGHAIGRHKK